MQARLTEPLHYERRRKTYKYRVTRDFTCQTGIEGYAAHVFAWTRLYDDGVLLIRAGYAWDGASGPAIDTKNWMRPSLVHDALYQLMRAPSGNFDHRQRKNVDLLMYHMLREEGMGRARARWSYWAVRTFGGRRARKRTSETFVVG